MIENGSNSHENGLSKTLSFLSLDSQVRSNRFPRVPQAPRISKASLKGGKCLALESGRGRRLERCCVKAAGRVRTRRFARLGFYGENRINLSSPIRRRARRGGTFLIRALVSLPES